MNPYYTDPSVTVYAGDCLDVMRELPDASVDAVVTDPPYGLGFMGKEWDKPGRAARATTTAVDSAAHNRYSHTEYGGASYGGDYLGSLRHFQSWCEQWAAECLRVLRPGGHLLAFGGTRTYHRLACAVEDAGFEIRDSISWLYGSGFPKSLDVSKAIDKAAGAERTEVVGSRGLSLWKEGAPGGAAMKDDGGIRQDFDTVNTVLAPVTDEAKRWAGWGTALKPAHEPIVVARKPLAGTVAGNVVVHGTGALNVDGCRVPGVVPSVPQPDFAHVNGRVTHLDAHARNGEMSAAPAGRWPTNVLLDQSQADALDAQTGVLPGGGWPARRSADGVDRTAYGTFSGQEGLAGRKAEDGGASRFFPTFRYEAKAPQAERPRVGETVHPTVKPLDLMRWLVRLVTPRGGVVLDPFLGSGTTAALCCVQCTC